MRSETAEAVTRSQRPLGGLLHAPLLNGRFYGWRQVRGGAIIRSTFFGRVNASSEEGLGNPPFFWQFVKSGLDTPSCLEMVELLEAPAFSTHTSPWMAAFPAAFFIACGRPNQERSSPPLLTVLLLLTGEHQEEGDGASNEGTWRPLRVGNLRGLFLPLWRGRYSGCSPKVLRTALLLSFPPNQSLRSLSHKGFYPP